SPLTVSVMEIVAGFSWLSDCGRPAGVELMQCLRKVQQFMHDVTAGKPRQPELIRDCEDGSMGAAFRERGSRPRCPASSAASRQASCGASPGHWLERPMLQSAPGGRNSPP